MPEKMATLTRYKDKEQAQYHKEILENAGIPVIIADDRTTDPPELPSAPRLGGHVLLQVAEHDLMRAGEVLEETLDTQMGDNPSAT